MIANSIVCNGSIRCLNKIYADNLTASSATINGNLTASGNVTGLNLYSTAGYLYLNGKLAVRGHDAWLRFNDTSGQFSSGIYFGNSVVRTDGEIQGGGGGSWFKSNSNGTWITPNLYTTNQYNTGTIVTENANVINTLRATKFDLQTVSQTGGSLYVSPTIRFPNSGTSVQVTAGSPAIIKITDAAAITSTTMAGIVWTVNSKVKVSGTIGGKTTGVMEGTITAIDVSNGHYITISCSGGAASSLVSGNYGSGEIKDLTVACFELYSTTSQKTFRVGIWLNSYDIYSSANINGENKAALSAIRIYGGTDDLPVACLGNLQQAGLGQVNGENVGGWGLFTKRGYFQGMIVSTSGKIGGWTIGANSIYKQHGIYQPFIYAPDTPIDNNAAFGVSKTENGTTTYPFLVRYSGKLEATGAVISGTITATDGNIGGWVVKSSYLGYGTIGNSGSAFLWPTGTTATIAGVSRSGLVITAGASFGVTNAGALYSNSAVIGNWTVNSTQIYSNANPTSGTAGYQYGFYLESPSSRGAGTYALYAGHRHWTGSAYDTDWDWNTYITYDGKFFSKYGSIAGWTIDGTSGLKNSDSSVIISPVKRKISITDWSDYGKVAERTDVLLKVGDITLTDNKVMAPYLNTNMLSCEDTVFVNISDSNKTLLSQGRLFTGANSTWVASGQTGYSTVLSNSDGVLLRATTGTIRAKNNTNTYDVIDSCYMANDMWGRMKFTVENTNVNVWGPANHLTLHSDGEIYVSKSSQTFGLFSLFNSSVKKKTAAINSTTTITSGVLYIAFIYHADTANSNGVYMFRGGSNNIWPIKTGSNLTLQISGGTNFYWNSSSGSPTCYLFYN